MLNDKLVANNRALSSAPSEKLETLRQQHSAVQAQLGDPAFVSALEAYLRHNLKIELSVSSRESTYSGVTITAKLSLNGKVISEASGSAYV